MAVRSRYCPRLPRADALSLLPVSRVCAQYDGSVTLKGGCNRIEQYLRCSRQDCFIANTRSLKRVRRLRGLAKHVRRLIGCFRDQVVFIDHQFWLCTWAMEPVYSKYKRHYFLPKDWLSPTALRLIFLNAQRTLMCPRNGEVAIVRSGLKC